MGIEKRNVNELREKIKECVGQQVVLRDSLKRGKSLKIEGTLVGGQNDFFTVQSNDVTNQKYTNKYIDLLTSNPVELLLVNNENCTSILDLIGDNTVNKENF